MYTLAHGHFADFDDVPDPATLDKSELPSGALILALQAVCLYSLCPGLNTILIVMLGLPCVPLVEHWNICQRHLSEGILFSRYIRRRNPS